LSAQPAAPAADDTSAAVVSLYQAQKKIYARAVSGWFAGWRWALVFLTQALFYGLPWLEWNARQAVLFDLGARRFYIFNLVLYPQDFIYLTGLLIISAYSLFLFTAVAGRLWCGYACPQTVYTEIFMWVERKLEGDRAARMKRDAGPWTAERTSRFAAKHAAWVLIALWTGVTFVGYFTPIRDLVPALAAFAVTPWETFWVMFYGFATYGNAGWMREQVCKYMCPYARFQGAMFDKDTLVISYDTQRGDPRGTRSRKVDAKSAGLGDCIDCGLCVQVCPTGIDIRNGQQYECIGCAACIDVCDGVMDKMNYPRGLVRYTSLNGMEQGLTRAQMLKRALRPRVIVYTVILVVIVGAWMASLALRPPLRVDVVRDRATLARMVEDGWIENVYKLQLMNVTERTQRLRIEAEGLPGLRVIAAESYVVEPAGARWVAVTLRVPPETALSTPHGAHAVRFTVQGEDGAGGTAVHASEASTFVLPR
jgi:cytochrome c oxidase accessory protein FixG